MTQGNKSLERPLHYSGMPLLKEFHLHRKAIKVDNNFNSLHCYNQILQIGIPLLIGTAHFASTYFLAVAFCKHIQ